MASGAVGAAGAQFAVLLAGHANPGHVGADSVSVTVSQTAPPMPVPEAAPAEAPPVAAEEPVAADVPA